MVCDNDNQVRKQGAGLIPYLGRLQPLLPSGHPRESLACPFSSPYPLPCSSPRYLTIKVFAKQLPQNAQDTTSAGKRSTAETAVLSVLKLDIMRCAVGDTMFSARYNLHSALPSFQTQ